MGQAGMKNNWKRNTRYMGVFAVLAAVFCMIVVLNINTGNVQISVPEILRILFLKKGTQVQMNIIWKIRLPQMCIRDRRTVWQAFMRIFHLNRKESM